MLIFNLKKEWFEKIKSGEKTHEYRIVKDYWNSRLMFLRKGDPIIFRLGYCKAFDPEREILATVINISIINGKNTDLQLDADVWDIEFELS